MLIVRGIVSARKRKIEKVHSFAKTIASDYTPSIIHIVQIRYAEVVEWYTRATQNRVPRGLRVRVPPSVPKSIDE